MSSHHDSFAQLANGRALPLEDLPTLALDGFQQAILQGVASGQRVCALFGDASPHAGMTQLYVVMADDERNRLWAGRTQIEGAQFPSLTPQCPQVHMFEREIAENVPAPAGSPVKSASSETASLPKAPAKGKRAVAAAPASKKSRPVSKDTRKAEQQQLFGEAAEVKKKPARKTSSKTATATRKRK